jgi:hypothetical protein
MKKKAAFSLVSVIILTGILACSKRSSGPQLTVEIPAGFSGNFSLEMGVRGAAPLQQAGNAYLAMVPATGKLTTSTFLEKPRVTFKNTGQGTIWGYSQSIFTTGDGIAVSGKIEFFVGTQKDFEAEQQKKNRSGHFPAGDFLASAV